MASVAQIQANRSNAQRSTGPRTAAGKERASHNALKHGLLAQEAVIQGEDPAEFECYREGMLKELAPAGAVEAMLAERVVGLSWRLLRAQRLQNAAFAALDEGEPTELLEARHEEWKQVKGSDWDRGLAGVVDEDGALGRAVVEDFGGARVLDRLLMYERRIESSLYRTMTQLRANRHGQTSLSVAPICVDGFSRTLPRSKGGLPATEEAGEPAELGSFGANAGPEPQTRETAFGSSETLAGLVRGMGVPRSGRGQALPMAGNHGRDARATKITPDGASTSDEERATQPTAETLHDRSGETNPIRDEHTRCAHECDGLPPTGRAFRCPAPPEPIECRIEEQHGECIVRKG